MWIVARPQAQLYGQVMDSQHGIAFLAPSKLSQGQQNAYLSEMRK